MSTRVLSKIQAATGTAIVGSDLDRLGQDVVDRINEVPIRDIERRFTQTQVVIGWLPGISGIGGTTFPFLDQTNSAAFVVGTVPAAFENPARAKSVYLQPACDAQVVWTTALYLHRPTILREVSMALLTDTTFNNDFLYAGAVPPGKMAGRPVDDIHLLVTVDNPWRTEDQSRNALVLRRGDFLAQAEEFYVGAVRALGTFNNMLPVHPSSHPDGLMIHLRDLYVPLPERSRLRLSLVLPHYAGDLLPWGATPIDEQYYSGTITLYEPLEPA